MTNPGNVFKSRDITLLTKVHIVNEAEVDVFLEFSCFFDDPMDVGHLTSGSSVFSISSLNIWKFLGSRTIEVSLGEF